MNANTRFVGYTFNPNEKNLFSAVTTAYIQREIYERSKKYFPRGVLVPLETVSSVLDSVYVNYSPRIGYTGPTFYAANMATSVVNQTITIILDDVVNTLGIERTNASLDIWDSVLGDFNRNGLRSHSGIKVRDNKPPSGLFFENY